MLDQFANPVVLWAQGFDPFYTFAFFAVVFVAALAIGILIAAIILRAAVGIVCKIDLPFGTAALYCILLSLLTSAVTFPLNLAGGFAAAGPHGGPANPAIAIAFQLGGGVLGFIISGVFYGLMIKDNGGMPIGIPKGFLVTLAYIAIWIGILIVCGIIGFAVVMLLSGLH